MFCDDLITPGMRKVCDGKYSKEKDAHALEQCKDWVEVFALGMTQLVVDALDGPPGIDGQAQGPEPGGQVGQAVDVLEVGLQGWVEGVGHARDEGGDDRVDPPDGQQQQHDQAVEDLEVVGADRAPQAPEEHAGQPGQGGRQGEHGQLGPGQVQPQGGAGSLAVGHGRQLAPEPGPAQGDGAHG